MSKNLKDFRGIWTTFALSLFALSLVAQPKDNAPYSRFGLGDPVNQSLSAAGFAGLTATYADPLHVNLENPASYGWLNTATFEAGLFAEHSKLKFKDQEASIWTGNLSHLVLAFPMRNRLNDVIQKKQRNVYWGMNLALLPNSVIGYDIQTEEVQPGVDTTRNIFQGTGGTNKFVWGNGIRYKNFSAGLNLSYLFGQLESERIVRFPDLTSSYSDKFQDNISIRGLQWSLGVQYRYDFDKTKKEDAVYTGKSLVIGAYGNSPTNFKSRSTVYRIGEYMTANETLLAADTLFSEVDLKGNGKMPAEFAIGLMYQQLGKFRIGGEYQFEGWSNYENDAKPEKLLNSHRLAFGAEYIPDVSSYNNYIKRIRYRAGFYHRTDPRLKDLTQYAVTLGFGLPVILPRQQTSFVNVAFEFGQYNTSDAIKENFVKIAIGFTLNDSSWFFKRRFG